MRISWDGGGDGGDGGDGGARGSSSSAVRAAILQEWVSYVKRRLDLGASRTSACAARTLQVRSSSTVGFIELSEAREQARENEAAAQAAQGSAVARLEAALKARDKTIEVLRQQLTQARRGEEGQG